MYVRSKLDEFDYIKSDCNSPIALLCKDFPLHPCYGTRNVQEVQ